MSAVEDLLQAVDDECALWKERRYRLTRIEPLLLPGWVRHVEGLRERCETWAQAHGFSGVELL